MHRPIIRKHPNAITTMKASPIKGKIQPNPPQGIPQYPTHIGIPAHPLRVHIIRHISARSASPRGFNQGTAIEEQHSGFPVAPEYVIPITVEVTRLL